MSPVLSAEDLTLGYGAEPVVRGLDLSIADGEFTVIVGPNGCGKSTLLKALGRINRPVSGRVLLHGTDIRSQRAKAVARRMAMLPQSPTAPEGITVRGLAARGRFPHHTLLRQWSPADDEAVDRALELTGLSDLADTRVGSLSGGQRQRAWVAMVLAQDTGVLLLDEPTTYLDIAHQYDLLELFADLHRRGRTVVAVLHDLAQAARFATRLVLMDRGSVVADGTPDEVITADRVREVFGLSCDVVPDPRTRTPLVIPHERS
ncbi:MULTISPECIES: ABC transporter ATP-binding protein [Nocardiopsis]|uniref:ABC transporter ATP-binding protein n=1 Tax=Nocardiopsis changdeensis TaxID=2831969 RepID=A0ABX8BRL1_9ACTN|nr:MULTISPECIES: ABC transporter ATP-binding protein [Nocardiopsis]QUX24686.1 ABC transporter ATP-binding protein [Nocardiopsis changdeensis]QYX35074.1 ABC transporter ATP-binding protein [Nocardiopsis sp. MT53]